MARLIRQSDTIRQDFYTRIQSKIRREKEEHQQRVMREIPFLGDILSPFAGFMFDIDQITSSIKGDIGERHVLNAAVRRL